MDLLGRQELENPQGPFATGTVPDRWSCGVVGHVCWRRSRQQSSAEAQALSRHSGACRCKYCTSTHQKHNKPEKNEMIPRFIVWADQNATLPYIRTDVI